MSDRWCFWDSLMFAFTASMTLWPDLAPTEVATVLAAIFGAALIELNPEQASDTEVRS